MIERWKVCYICIISICNQFVMLTKNSRLKNMVGNLKIVIFFASLWVSISVFAQDDSLIDSLHCYKNEAQSPDNVQHGIRTTPVIWEKYFYPHENYQDLIRLCNRLNNPLQMQAMLDMLTDVELLLNEYGRPKAKLYMIMATLNDRLDNKINASNYMLLAVKDMDAQLAAQDKINDQQQYRIYELQSVLLNKQKRSNIVFFLFIALAGAFFFLTRDSKMRHLRKKQKEQKQLDNPDSIDEDLIDKINIAVNLITQKKNPNLSAEEIEGLGFESKEDFILSFQIVIGMTPKEYYEKNILK